MYKNIVFLLLISFAGYAQADLGIIDKNTSKLPRSGLIRLSSDSLKLYFRGVTGASKEVVSTNNTYANPSWITSLANSKITGLGSIALLNTINLTSNVTGLLPDGNISSASTWNAKQSALSGTGFVKIVGTTISYDNSTYLSTSSASSTYAPLASPTFTGTVTMPSTNINTRRVADYTALQAIVSANNFIGLVYVDTDSTNGNLPSTYIVKNNSFQWILSL